MPVHITTVRSAAHLLDLDAYVGSHDHSRVTPADAQLAFHSAGTHSRAAAAPASPPPAEANIVGTGASETITGTNAADDIHGEDGNDTLIGLDGNDMLWGDRGSDQLEGGEGNDDLYGDSGDDILIGGNGDDELTAGEGNDLFIGGAGNDRMYGGSGFADTVSFANSTGPITVHLDWGTQDTGEGMDRFDEIENVIGSNQNDFLEGDSGQNTLNGGGGDDRLDGYGGDDVMIGGSGNDVFVQSGGNDVITDFTAGGTDDRIEISFATSFTKIQVGADLRLVFDNGNSILLKNVSAASFTAADINLIETPANTVNFGGSDDSHAGTAAVDFINGAGGADVLHGAANDDALSGGDAGDSLFGEDGDDVLNGGNGNDVVQGGAGEDYQTGGSGNDTFNFAAGDGNDVIADFTAGGTDDSLFVTGFTGYYLRQDGGDLRVILATDNLYVTDSILLLGVTQASFTAADINLTFLGSMVTGTSFSETVTGTNGDEIINGLEGDDILYGLGGNDQIDGYEGDDFIYAGLGNDGYNGGNGYDTLDFSDFTFGIQLNLGIEFPAQDIGGGMMKQVYSIDRLNGTNFADTLSAGDHGRDIYGGGGADTIAGGTWLDGLFGEAGDDHIDAGAQADKLGGGLGNDTLIGGAGNDTFLFGTGDGQDVIEDFVAGGTDDMIVVTGYTNYTKVQVGADLKIVFDANNFILLKNVLSANFISADINISLSGAGSVINGTEGDDTLTGDSGPNNINGLGGNDTLTGLDGDDTLNGGGGDDILVGGAGADAFTGTDGGGATDFDTVNYVGELSGITLNLATNVNTGNATGDTFSSIENFRLTNFGDTFTGSAAADRVHGEDGNDFLYGMDGVDRLYGEGGDDYLDGGNGSDFILFSTATSGITLNLQLTTAQNTGQGMDTVLNIESISGSAFDDIFTGASGATSQILGGGGNDIITGGAGNDFFLDGGEGNDIVSGGAGGQDSINGNNGNDVLYGGVTDGDGFDGGAGDDIAVIGAGVGADRFIGGSGIDTVDYSNATAGVVVKLWIFGTQNTIGSGIDRFDLVENVIGSAFNDILEGSLAASPGSTIQGGKGDDTIAMSGSGSAQDDVLVFNLGDGNDTVAGFVAGGTKGHIVVTGYASYTKVQEGADLRIVFDANNSILLKNVTAAAFTVDDINIPESTGPNVITGTESAETLTGTSGADQIDGLGGNDTLKGLDANDILNGGDGNDILEGGLGNDQLNGGAGTADKADYRTATAGVTVNLSILIAQNTVGAGTDTLSGMEEILGSAFNDILTGDAGSNSLQGKAGDDQLFGGDDGDTLTGGAGADAMNGGNGLDYASYGDALTGVGLNLTTGIHTGDALGDTFVNIERYRLSSFNDTLIGSAGTDQAYGNDGSDTLSGAGGIDKLYGQNNSDTLNGDAGNDILLGGAGADIINGGADRDTASYEDMTQAVTLDLAGATSTLDAIGDVFNSIEVFWLTGFNDTFIGSAGDDEVRGNAGIDTLNGMNGSDRLRGEDGNDILNGGEGDDFLWGDAGTDQLNGGNGTDYATYTYSQNGVTINLTTGVNAGEALGDTYNSVERFQLGNQSTKADSFTGASGNDWVAGYKGADTLNGMDGNDTLNGGEHNDVLNGGIGNDKLIAGTGNDSMTGGTGADQFWFDVGLFGADTVTDFENGVDKIRITSQAGIDNINDLVISQAGANVLITLPDGSTITLNNTTAGNIDATDFLWI